MKKLSLAAVAAAMLIASGAPAGTISQEAGLHNIAPYRGDGKLLSVRFDYGVIADFAVFGVDAPVDYTYRFVARPEIYAFGTNFFGTWIEQDGTIHCDDTFACALETLIFGSYSVPTSQVHLFQQGPGQQLNDDIEALAETDFHVFGLLDHPVGAIELIGAGWESGTVTYTFTGAPEPSTWAELLGGFALIGAALRRGRGKTRPERLQWGG
jgi:hypothetical protein